MNETELKIRLADWGATFARSDPDPQAPGYAEAQAIEAIVAEMERFGRWKEARVIRAEYTLADQPESIRLVRLRRLGLSMSRASYYIYLDAAHAYVAGAFGSTS